MEIRDVIEAYKEGREECLREMKEILENAADEIEELHGMETQLTVKIRNLLHELI